MTQSAMEAAQPLPAEPLRLLRNDDPGPISRHVKINSLQTRCGPGGPYARRRITTQPFIMIGSQNHDIFVLGGLPPSPLHILLIE